MKQIITKKPETLQEALYAQANVTTSPYSRWLMIQAAKELDSMKDHQNFINRTHYDFYIRYNEDGTWEVVYED